MSGVSLSLLGTRLIAARQRLAHRVRLVKQYCCYQECPPRLTYSASYPLPHELMLFLSRRGLGNNCHVFMILGAYWMPYLLLGCVYSIR